MIAGAELRERGSRLQELAPAITLIFAAPFVAEVLSGATRLSVIFVFIPESMVWGCGALIIREVVCRWRGGWTSMFLLALALSTAEEMVIQQTSIAPLPWPGANAAYGRAWGVNWIYLLYMLGYESVWVVLVPVLLTYLIFPARRAGRWLSTRGSIISGGVFLLGSFIAWFAWTQQARPIVLRAAPYRPPAALITAGLAAIALFATAGWGVRNVHTQRSPSRKAPKPALLGMAGFALGMCWNFLIWTIFAASAPAPAQVVFVAGVLWAVLAAAVVRRWESAGNWGRMHEYALVFSAAVVCMVSSLLQSSAWARVDQVGAAIMDLIALACLIALGRKLARDAPHSHRAEPDAA